MSVCMFIASDSSLKEVNPTVDELNINYEEQCFIINFKDVSDYSTKKYGVYVEWEYSEERAQILIDYIKEVLENTDEIELNKVWLDFYYNYEESPIINKKNISITELNNEMLKEIYDWNLFSRKDNRPTFYRLIIEK